MRNGTGEAIGILLWGIFCIAMMIGSIIVTLHFIIKYW